MAAEMNKHEHDIKMVISESNNNQNHTRQEEAPPSWEW